MYTLLEKHIQALQELHNNSNTSASEDFIKHEKSINAIIVLLTEFLDGVDELADFSFPYYDQLLELTYSREILHSLVDFSYSVLTRERDNQEALVHMSKLFFYTTPFIRLLYQSCWDNGHLVKNSSMLTTSNMDKNKVSEGVAAVLIKVLEYGSDIGYLVEKNSLIGLEDKRLFVSSVMKKMGEHYRITRERNEQKYFQVLGEITIAYQFLRPEMDEFFLAGIMAIQNFQGLFLHNMKYKTISPKLHNLSLDRCQQKFKYVPHPSVVDIMLEKAREINEKKDGPIEDSIKAIEVLTIYTSALIKNGELNTLIRDEDKQPKQMQEFLRRLYTIPRGDGSNLTEALPPIIETLNYAYNLYKKFYSTVNDECANILGKLSDSPQDKVNILTDSIMNLTYCYMDEMSRTHTTEDGQVHSAFSEEYYASLNLIYKHMIHMLETYSFESNYVSVLGLTAIFVGFQEIVNHKAAHYLELPLVLIKKLELLVQWSYTKDFADIFEKHSNPKHLIKVVDMLLELMLRTLYFFEDEDLETEAKRDYLTHLSTFTTMDFIISRKESSQLNFTNENAREAHEKIIRLYTLLHLNSQILTYNEEEADQIVFYTYERLSQVWDIVLNYSTWECRMTLEFYDSVKIIDYLFDRGQGEAKFYKVFNHKVLSAVYDKSFLNLHVDHSMRDGEGLLDVLVSLNGNDPQGYDLFLQEISKTLKKNFEFIQEISKELQKKFEENDPDFTRVYLYTENKIFDFATRLRPILKAMDSEEDFGKSQDLRQVLKEYLPEFLTSPAFYFIHLDSMRDFKNLLPALAVFPTVLEKVMKIAGSRILELVDTVKQELLKEDNSVLKKKVVVLNAKNYNVDTFHSDTFFESPKDIYTINSKLFLMTFLNDLRLFNNIFSPNAPMISVFTQELSRDLPSITEGIVNITLALVNQKLSNAENPDVIVSIIVDDSWMQSLNMDISTEYFNTKLKVLTRVMTEEDATKTKEENLLTQVSASLLISEILPTCTVPMIRILMLENNTLEKIMEGSFAILEKFQKIIRKNQTDNSNNETVCLLELEFMSNTDEMKRLRSCFSLFVNGLCVTLQEIVKLLYNCRYGSGSFFFGNRQNDLTTENKLLKRTLPLLIRLLDKIDYQLLALCLLNEENVYLLSSVTSSLYLCHINFFSSIIMNQDVEKRGLLQPQQPSFGFSTQPLFRFSQKPSFGFGGTGNSSVSSQSLFSNPPAPALEQTSQETVKATPEDSILTISQTELNDAFSQFLSKMVIFNNLWCSKFEIHPVYRPPFEDFLAKCKLFLDEKVKVEELGYPFDIQIYRNPAINRLRILAPIFYFVNKFTHSQQMDLETVVYFTRHILSLEDAVLKLVDQISVEDLQREKEQQLVEMDIVMYYREIMTGLILVVKSDLIAFSHGRLTVSEFTSSCEELIRFLKKWSELIPVYKYTSNGIMNLFKNSDLILVLYAYLQCPGKAQVFLEDKHALNLLVNHSSNYLYVIAESFALQAYEAEKILPLKLKSLVYLDKSGDSIIRNSCIKQLEKFWYEQIVQAWRDNFAVEKDEKAKNEHAENIIAFTGFIDHDENFNGKMKLSVAGNSTTIVSTLSFLHKGMNPHCKTMLETIMKNIVSNIYKHIEQLNSTTNDDKQDYIVLLHDQIGCLAGLVKNYPELSVIVTSYKIEDFPEGTLKSSSLFPQAVEGESFLRFFVKFACYLYRSPAANLLENLITKHETPILIQYKGERVLLSAYNELIVFQEIINTLEESSSNDPVTLFNTLYSASIWKILSELSIHLLNLTNWPQQKDFKLEIISALYSVCLRTMEVYYNVHVFSSLWKEEELVVYELLEKLSQLELDLKTRRNLHKGDQSKDEKQITQKAGWICSVLREQVYLGQNPLLEHTHSQELQSQTDPTILEECELLKENYKPTFKEIELEKFIEILERPIPISNRKPGKNKLEDVKPFDVKLFTFLTELNLRSIPENSCYGQEKKVVQDKMFKLLATDSKIQYQSSMHADIDNIKLPPKTLQGLDFIKPPLSFRVLVKKELKWRFAKKKGEHLQELLKENPQEDFSQLIKKIGLKNISNLIKANRRRIKLLVRTQHEKQLLSKLQVLLDKQVNINDIMSLETDVDNLEFYNQQNELDKKLILLLAQKDFIETLSQDIQQQSKSLKKALLDEENLKKARENEEGEEEEEKVENPAVATLLENNDKKPIKTTKDQQSQPTNEFGIFGSIKEAQKDKEKVTEVEEKKDEEEEDNDEDYEEVSDFSEEEEQQQKINEPKDNEINEDEEENDEDFEDVSEGEDDAEREEEKEEETKKEIPVQPQINEQRIFESLFQPAAGFLLEDKISSACHTREVSESLEEKNEGYDEEYDEYGEPLTVLEEEDGEHSVKYNYDSILRLVVKKGENNIMVTSNVFIAEFNKAEKMLNDMKVSFRSSEIAFKDLEIQASIEQWANQVISLFGHISGLHKLYSKSANSITLFYRYLFLTLLDVSRESIVIPLLTLHLSGFELKSFKNLLRNNSRDEMIIMFLMHYALRSPSIFFRKFNIDNFKPFFKDQQEQEYDAQEKTTLYDLVLKTFIRHQCEKTDSGNKNIKQWTQRLIIFLTQMLYKFKEDIIPTFVKEFRNSNDTPITKSTFQQLLKAIEAGEDYTGRDKFGPINHLLKSLATIPSFNKEILITYEKALAQFIPAEKALLTDFMNKANQVLSNNSQRKLEDVQFFGQFVSHIKVKVAKSLSTFIEILNEIKSTDLEVIKFITDSHTLNIDLKEVALDHMKTFELIFKLKEAKYLRKHNDLRLKLEDMLEIPVHYQVFLSRLKELTSATTHTDHLDFHNLPGMGRSVSDQEGLAVNIASKNKDITNFQHVLLSWLNKSREYINSTIKLIPQKKALDMLLVNKFSWVLDFTVKEKILRDAIEERNAEEEMKHNYDEDDPSTTVFIRRKHIIEDTLKEFEDKKHTGVLFNFKIEFVKEPGVDQGGLKKEWLTLISKELFDPRRGLFNLSPNLRTLHPNPLSVIQPGELTYFRLAGTIAGLAIKEEIPINVNFSKSFLKLIMGHQPNLNDLEDIEPDLMHSLNWMLTNPIADLEMPFTYELDVFGRKIIQELIENGGNVLINEDNKESFVSKMYLAKALKEVEKQIHSFKEGFYEILPEKLLKLFSSGELEILISGQSEIDIGDLKKYAVSKDMGKEHPLVKWFWEIIEIMDQPMLANLLFFITGSSQVPHGGFKNAPIVLMKGSEDTSSLPIAHTCFSQLEIPLYDSKEQFYEKLVLAISEGKEGFYIA